MFANSVPGRPLLALGLAALLLPLFLDGAAAARGQAGAAGGAAMQNRTDGEVIAALASGDREEASAAVTEVLSRGERMIPLLLNRKGDKQYFHGYGLGHKDSAFTVPSPTGNKEQDEGSVITVEVAALYLISAIYYQTPEFAQAPYLTDGTYVKRRKYNTRKRVALAWAAVEKWVQVLKKEGLESLRSKQHAPLKDSAFHFWGSI